MRETIVSRFLGNYQKKKHQQKIGTYLQSTFNRPFRFTFLRIRYFQLPQVICTISGVDQCFFLESSANFLKEILYSIENTENVQSFFCRFHNGAKLLSCRISKIRKHAFCQAVCVLDINIPIYCGQIQNFHRFLDYKVNPTKQYSAKIDFT